VPLGGRENGRLGALAIRWVAVLRFLYRRSMSTPNLSGLMALWHQLAPYRLLLAALRPTGRGREDTSSGSGGSARVHERRSIALRQAVRPYLAAALATDLSVPILILVSRSDIAHQWHRQLRTWLPEHVPLHHFPERRRLPFERAAPDRLNTERRIAVLRGLDAALRDPNAQASGERPPGPIVVASARAALQHTVMAETFRRHARTYRVGQTVSLRGLLSAWYGLGYVSDSMVVQPATFSRRGGIVDVFPVGDDQPARIELFGDQIDTMRRFDPATQRSTGNIATLTVPPAREALPCQGPAGAQTLATHVLDSLAPPAWEQWERDLERLQEGENFPDLDLYLPYLYPRPDCIWSHLPENAFTVVDDWTAIQATVAEIEREARRIGSDSEVRGDLPPGFAADQGVWDDLQESLSERSVVYLGAGPVPAEAGWPEVFQAGPRYAGRIQDVLAACHDGIGHDRRVVVSRQAERLAELLRQDGIGATPVTDLPLLPSAGSLTLVQGNLPEGWVCHPGDGLPATELVTDAEIFGWAPVIPRRPEKPRSRLPREAFFTDLNMGEYVVHLEYGVGAFRGLVQKAINGVEREYLLIEYAAGDKLYVPVHQADRVSRYVGIGTHTPAIHRLGKASWELVKQQAKKAVAEIADDLLALYSQREVVTGHAFSPDTAWQAELEASFPYEETSDQRRAIEAVKRDMQRARPMDRLVCGDVGYGKTEVALRAAFKAVMGGKQVAMLVPTTVLAQQHFNTFAQRLAPFPIEVEMLSRFRPPAEQRRILDRMLAGQVDIVIGTHRLLSRDVQFRDIGLLIVDEEQRFGVTHKERLKRWRTKVDVLTLTATPIPRTLHMALTGVRDMSTIDTPPEERQPIVTHIGPYEKALIRRAILEEMDRGGQTFFVHNRVLSIHAMAQHLCKLVPEARIAIAHGQMKERKLEQVMLDFSAGEEYDVLVCTSIIESGLDMPNVNTIIIHRADQFGLAQLYQLRGRVGRGARRAYAFLIHPRLSSLGEAAKMRMEAIGEATELGAGFRLAMRDLEIRGAGELLGARQHGHIAAVGFNLYTRLLAQAVAERKARSEGKVQLAPRLFSAPKVDLPIPAYLPSDYVPSSNLRLRLYQQLSEVTSLEKVRDLADEWVDRFGPLPDPAKNLLYVLELRVRACAGAGSPVSAPNVARRLSRSPTRLPRAGFGCGGLPEAARRSAGAMFEFP